MSRRLLLGCLADDFTGAGDAASFIAGSGLKTILFNGIPEETEVREADAVVIALKTRTEERDKAVADSLRAAAWLLKMGAQHIYIKYCSTFDSTAKGNIGPVMDAVLEYCGERASILCPALPVNGRVVRKGKLYVNGVLLEESPMRYHPLTPMRQSDIGKLMEPQSKYPCVMLDQEQMARSKEEIWSDIEQRTAGLKHYYLVPDYEKDSDGKKIAEVFGQMRVLSGGSGILTDLCERYCQDQKQNGGCDGRTSVYTDGKGIILAGSCSAATRRQIKEFGDSGNFAYKVEPGKLMTGEQTAQSVWQEIEKNAAGKEILIYSSDEPDKVEEAQKAGKEQTAAMIEEFFASLAVKAEASGYKRIIVAGGETSGAVTKALGYGAYHISESIAPGVPVMIPIKNPSIRLVLKSGNFGQPDFFLRALERTAASCAQQCSESLAKGERSDG